MPKERSDAGTFTSTITPEQVLEVFEEVEGPVVFRRDVVDSLGVTNPTARRHLDDLVEEGVLTMRKQSGRTIYWRVDESASDTDSADH